MSGYSNIKRTLDLEVGQRYTTKRGLVAIVWGAGVGKDDFEVHYSDGKKYFVRRDGGIYGVPDKKYHLKLLIDDMYLNRR